MEAISLAPHCGQVLWLGRVVFDLITETLDVYKDGVVIQSLALPYLGEDLLFGQEHPGILHKKAQQGEFFGGQGNLLVILIYGL